MNRPFLSDRLKSRLSSRNIFLGSLIAIVCGFAFVWLSIPARAGLSEAASGSEVFAGPESIIVQRSQGSSAPIDLPRPHNSVCRSPVRSAFETTAWVPRMTSHTANRSEYS